MKEKRRVEKEVLSSYKLLCDKNLKKGENQLLFMQAFNIIAKQELIVMM